MKNQGALQLYVNECDSRRLHEFMNQLHGAKKILRRLLLSFSHQQATNAHRHQSCKENDLFQQHESRRSVISKL